MFAIYPNLFNFFPGALGLQTDGMCGGKIGFLNLTLTVQQKIDKIHTLTMHFPQIFDPFRTKKIVLFGQKFLVFARFTEIYTQRVHLTKVHPYSASLLS